MTVVCGDSPLIKFLRDYQQKREQQKRELLRKLPDPAQLQVALATWLETPLGKRLLEAESKQLNPVLSRIFGYHILQISSSNSTELLSESPVGHKISFAPDYVADIKQPVADAEALPLTSGSVDAVLVHHALDFTPDSHRLLREATRVIMPGGRLLIIGFNPISSWGLSKYLRWSRNAPWNARFITASRVTDCLKLLEFHVESVSYGAWVPPVNHAGLMRHTEKFERLGDRFQLPLGGLYMIVATKQVFPLTPVVRRWPRLLPTVIVRPVTEAAPLAAPHRQGRTSVVPHSDSTRAATNKSPGRKSRFVKTH
ncbi:hypothetical protein ACA910_002889 [Epithemia clementina (nom. ined.)]